MSEPTMSEWVFRETTGPGDLRGIQYQRPALANGEF